MTITITKGTKGDTKATMMSGHAGYRTGRPAQFQTIAFLFVTFVQFFVTFVVVGC